MERVRQLATQRPVVIFSRSSCCICHSIKTFFSELGVNAAVHELDEDPNGRETERALVRMGCNPAVPAVFIGGDLIGGTNDVMTLHLGGSLKPLLKRVGAIWV